MAEKDAAHDTDAQRPTVDQLPAWQAERRQRIVDAARAALERRDHEQIQIRDVARDAGVALGTLYRYFSSKDHLYAAVLQDWAGISGTTRRLLALDPEARIRARIAVVASAFERRPQFFKVLVSLQSTADANAVALLGEFSDTAQGSLTEDFAVLGPDAARDAAAMLWAIIYTRLISAVYHGQPWARVRQLADAFVDLLAPRLHPPA